MQQILEDIARSERGRRLLVNLLRGLGTGHVDKHVAWTVLSTVQQSDPPHDGCWNLHIASLRTTIFASPDDYQFQGPKARFSPAEWMTVKSMADLRYFMEDESGKLPPSLDDIVRIVDADGAQDGFPEEYYIRFAEILSDEEAGISFLLAKAHPNPKDPARRRASPSWYSRWCEYPHRADFRVPSGENAGRLRDWLGLPYGLQEPLFVVRARSEMEVALLDAYRPTPWDGFDNPLYKHRAAARRESEENGSAADIALLRKLSAPGSDVEGGPEIVSKGIRFDACLFVCEFLGLAPAPDYDIYEGPFHQVLLGIDETIHDVIEHLLGHLLPRSAH